MDGLDGWPWIQYFKKSQTVGFAEYSAPGRPAVV